MAFDDAAYANAPAALVTMHGKARVIAPILRETLGLDVRALESVNTDRFGAFSRETPRAGSQLDAARAKIAAGLALAPWARFGVASEGSFGPHPQVPFVAVGRELVLLRDRETGLEISGHDASVETNFAHVVAHTVEDAVAFAARAGFPEHGLIVMGVMDGGPDPRIALDKAIGDLPALTHAVERAISSCGAAHVETDMRAHRNPTRMEAIGRATRDLARRFLSRCLQCGQPGYDVTERIAGLPCADCGYPTRETIATIFTCASCGHAERRPHAARSAADPARCDVCNP